VQNVGNGWNRGIELEQRLGFGWLDAPLMSGLTLWANQTLLESKLQAADGGRRPFKDQPDYILNFGVDYEYAPWGSTINLAWTYANETEEVTPTGDRKTKSSQSVVDLAFYQKLTKNTRMFVQVQNLTDRGKQETNLKVNGDVEYTTEKIGRNLMAGLEVKF
jgi:outer membrane receptor protein involved in Fe transport